VPELEETEKYETPLCTIDENKFSIRERAVGLARRGFFVLPLHTPNFDGDKVICTCKKGDGCDRIGKHPQYDFMTLRSGVSDASRDPEMIRFWFEKWPDANLGIATGKRSDLLVLDVDGLTGAYALDEIENEFSPLPETLIQRTGKRHGKHYLFSYPEGVSIPNSVGDIGSGLDIRSDGGYIVSDPSIHASGRRYQIESWAAPLAPPPAWFVGLLLASKKAAKINALAAPTHPQATSPNYPAFIGDGIRNYKVFRYGCGLANSFSPDEKLSRLRRLNETRVQPPLDEIELLKVHKSSERYR
jgi:putative DNA primase/helicase